MLLKGVHRVRSRGRVYYYAWRGGPRINADPDTPEFAEQYAKARKQLRELPDGTTVSAIAIKYQNASDFGRRNKRKRKKAPSPKWLKEKKRFLSYIVEEFGPDDIKVFDDPRTRDDIIQFRDRFKKTPRKADQIIGELSAFLNWCIDRGFISRNLAHGIPELNEANRSEVIWEDHEIEAAVSKATPDVALVARLAPLTGIDRGDLMKLPKTAVSAGAIRFRRSKSGELVVIPIYDEVRKVLDDIDARNAEKEKKTGLTSTYLLTNSKVQQWSADGFSTGFRRAKIAAGVDKRFHDLRGTACTYFCSKGLTDDEIAEIMGWSKETVRTMRKVYAHDEEVARAKILRLDKNAERTKV